MYDYLFKIKRCNVEIFCHKSTGQKYAVYDKVQGLAYKVMDYKFRVDILIYTISKETVNVNLTDLVYYGMIPCEFGE